MTREEALSKLDEVIKGLSDTITRCNARGQMFQKWGTFLQHAVTQLKEIRAAL